MNKVFEKSICIAVALLVMATITTGCGGASSNNASGQTTATQASSRASIETSNPQLPLLEYSIDIEGTSQIAATIDNPNDVVTPYIEKKFNIKVTDIQGISQSVVGFQQRLGAYIAANNVPDVIISTQSDIEIALSTGKFADLTQYIDQMENLNKYFDSKFWSRFMDNGKKFQIPFVLQDLTVAPYKDDPYNIGLGAFWCLWVRDDILSKAGYKYTPLAELAKTTSDLGKLSSKDDFKIEPAIDTPEKFLDMLRKIKALNIKVGDQPLIPLDISGWSQFHLGTMYDFGHWRIDGQGQVAGFLGSPGAKTWYKMLNTLYYTMKT